MVLTCGLIAGYWLLAASELGLYGIAVADIAYYAVYAVVAFAVLNCILHQLSLRSMVVPIVKVIIASLAGYGVMLLVNMVMPYPDGMLVAILDVCVGGIIGLIVIYGGCYALKVEEIVGIIGAVKRRIFSR